MGKVSVSCRCRSRSTAIDIAAILTRTIVTSAILVGMLIVLSSSLQARQDLLSDKDKIRELDKIWVLDGSGIHNVGNLNLHVTNWGCFGSYPDAGRATSHYISAQWPANSSVEYLWIAGLWVGARKNGIKVVSTAAYDTEFRPPGSEDPTARIYESTEGSPGGARLPAPDDDDKDGMSDEDWQNGVDDDGDGSIDEDFAAIGKQMFTCWFTDDHPQSVVANPEHTPLHLFVRQESYQWDDEQFWDFVGVEYTIKNYGNDIIEDLYIGFFADGDVGVRGSDNLATDDLTGLWQGIRCAQKGETEVPVYISVAYFYDSDGDDGQATGYFGILFLGHDTDPLGETAPAVVGITSYQNFSGDQPYNAGGDPTTDEERYNLMMPSANFDRNALIPRDYRMLMSTGPFLELLPDSIMKLQVAFVCGEGLEGMLDAAASAAMVYAGNWFNIDGNPVTGTGGRETPIYGPVSEMDPDTCDAEEEFLSAARGEVLWVNADCSAEIELYNGRAICGGEGNFEDFQTGVNGNETQIKWLVGTAPPPPNMRIIPGDGKVTLLWDSLSETTPDPSTQEFDFEGYRIWRADNWDRPYGTSTLTGPPRELWQLLVERDIINGIGPDTQFDRPFSEGGWQYEPLLGLQNQGDIIKAFEESLWYAPLESVPCPPGLTAMECDTIEAIARYNLGFEGGRQYYKFVDTSVHNGMHYFYSITAFDHIITDGVPVNLGKYGDPASNFIYTNPISTAYNAGDIDDEVYVVPNPATSASMEPWTLEPNMGDPTGIKVEFRNLPACVSTVRIYTIAGDLVEIMHHDGSGGDGTLAWDLVSRNGQNVTSGVYLFTVDPAGGGFKRTRGKFVVIR